MAIRNRLSKYNRTIGNFAAQFFDYMHKHGFADLRVIPIRIAERAYLDEIWPELRTEARERSKETVALLDLIILANKV